MANQSEGPIMVFDASVSSINLALGQVLERLDSIHGLRGAVGIHDRVATEAGIAGTDVVRMLDIDATNPLFYLMIPEQGGFVTSPPILTDSTGGVVDNITHTMVALPDPADAPATADALRDDLVANLLPALRDNLALLTAQLNTIRERLQFAQVFG